MDHPRRTHKFLANGYPFQSVFAPIDVDRSLPEMFSTLNLSPEGRRSIPSGYSGAGEGLDHSNLGFNRFLNYDHEQQNLFSSGFDFGFDYGFDFDRMGCLESKNVFYSHPQFKIDDYEKQNVCCSSSSSFYNNNNNDNNNTNNNQNVGFMSVWSLRGGICKMAKDQNGCRILQAMLERSTMEEVEVVLCEVVSFVADLMKDQFGNYLVQKLVTMCNDGQKSRLVLSLIETPTDIILVCMNPHGTRAVQTLLESLNPNQVKLVVKALYRGAATLAVDPNGHHVIQYCLINFHSDINKPILTEIANKCYKIATDRSGCCVLQACVEHSRGELRTRIIAEIITNAVPLAEDPFGNYVLQHMLGLDIPELTELLVRQLKGNFAALSCNKYASNVVEKCLNESGEEMCTRIVMELVRSPNASMLLVDPYANFVIQSALKVSTGLAHDCLCGLISKNMSSMRTNLYGKKILERFEKKRVNFA